MERSNNMFFKKNNNSKATITSQIRILRCSSCGAILQDEDKSDVGYISSKRIENHVEEGLCDRCYNLRHYNASNNQFDADYQKILANALKTNSLIVFVIDLFSFEPSLIPNISSYLGDNLIVILNKRDILPKTQTDEEIIDHARKRLNAENIHPKEILIFSSYTKLNIEKLFAMMNQYRNGKDVYFVGAYLVGKSSIVTEMLRQYDNNTTRMITTKQVPGTVLDVMEIPLDETSSMYDTPGIYNPNSAINQLERETYKYIVPREEIQPRKIELDENQFLILGGVACLGNLTDSKTEFTLMASNMLEVTKSKKDKLEKTFEMLISSKQIRPISSQIKSIDDLERKEIQVPPKGHMTLIVFGLYNVRFEANNQKLVVYVPKNVSVRLIID